MYIYVYICIYIERDIYRYIDIPIVLSVCNGSHGIKVLSKKSFILHVIY